MKPKNVMLLGFVNRAVKYLDDHLDDRSDPKLREIKDIDFVSLREELRQDLNVSLGTMQSTVKTLLQAGEEAFDDFVGLHPEKGSLADELDRIFTGEEEKPVGKVEDLSELLSFYNLGNLDLDDEEVDVDLNEELPEEPVREIANQPLEVPAEETTDDVSEFFFPEEPLKSEADETEKEETPAEEETKPEQAEEVIPEENTKPEAPVQENIEERTVETEQPDPKEEYPEQKQETPAEETVEERTDETEDYMGFYIPKQAVSETEIPAETDDGIIEERPEEQKTEEAIILPETEEVIPQEPVSESEPAVPEEESIFLMSEEDNELLRQIAENVSRNEQKTDYVKNAEEEVHDLDEIFSEVLAHEDEEIPEDEVPEEIPVIDKDDIIRLAQDIDEKQSLYYGDLPVSFAEEEPEIEETPPEEPLPETEEVISEEPEPEEEEIYVSSLIEELKQRMLEEEELKRAKEEEYRQIYDRIHRIYPNLSNAFIRTVYELKDSIANEYPLNKEVIILHRCIFKDVESLRQFVEIALNHNFSINADEDKLMVDAIKEYVNADGRIITSIFEVANQSAQLGGTYDGYRVMLEEKA